MTNIGPVVASCLGSGEIKAIAAGRRTERELAVVRRHLSECARCRAAVAARAAGVPGPGETVVLKAQRKAAFPTGLKVASVVASLAVVAGAWRYAGAPANQHADATLAREATASVASLGSAPTSEQPATLASPPVPRAPSTTKDTEDAAIAQPAELPVRAAIIPSKSVRPRRTARRSRSLTRTQPAKPEVPAEEDEFDFGIEEPTAGDEPTPAPPSSRRRVIRRTLE